ncbi:MAG: M20 family metallopeptidase, partial [Nitrospinota bacterium]
VKITTRGRATHGANPEKGVNAIVHMARLIERLSSMPMPSFEPPGLPPVGGTANVSLIEGGIMFLAVPSGCSIWIDRRTVPGETTEKVLGEYRDLVKSLKMEEKEFEAEVIPDRPDSRHPSIVKRGLLPFITPPEEEVVGALKEGFRDALGREGELSFLQCWTEADFFVNDAGIPTALFGPGRLEMAHSAEEHVVLDDLVAAAKVYLVALASLLG